MFFVLIVKIRPALPGDVLWSGWRQATQPLTRTLFDPAIFPRHLLFGTSFRSRFQIKSATREVTARHRGKRMMGADQWKPDERKSLDWDSKKVDCLI